MLRGYYANQIIVHMYGQGDLIFNEVTEYREDKTSLYIKQIEPHMIKETQIYTHAIKYIEVIK